MALIDVTVAFVNDRNVFDEVPIYQLDELLLRYLQPPPSAPSGGIAGPGGIAQPGSGSVSDYTKVKLALIEQMQRVFDYQGKEKKFVEEAEGFDGRKYLRVVRESDPDNPNPHYPDGSVPVEGIVMDKSKHTVRTDSVIIDSLLGHGVALDNYALGLQQETLRQQQLENKKIELALGLIDEGDADKLEAYRSLFGSVDKELLKQVALIDND